MSFFVYTEYAGCLLSVVVVIDIQRCLLEILSDLPIGGIFRVTGEVTGIDQCRLMRKRCQYHIRNLRIIQEKQTVFVFRGAGSGKCLCDASCLLSDQMSLRTVIIIVTGGIIVASQPDQRDQTEEQDRKENIWFPFCKINFHKGNDSCTDFVILRSV